MSKVRRPRVPLPFHVPEEQVEGVRQLLAQALVVSIAGEDGVEQLGGGRRWDTEVEGGNDVTYRVCVWDPEA